MGIGDWGLGIGDWAQSPIPNPQSPIPNPHVLKINIVFQIYNIFKFSYLIKILNYYINKVVSIYKTTKIENPKF